MGTIGYGEDGLTCWALTTHLEMILTKLQDDSAPENRTVFFRPSFGRAGGNTSSQFGEFDAILATPQAVYLIESKWDNGGRPPPTVVLEEVQIQRHRIFTWLLERWWEVQPGEWCAFHAATQHAFTETFPYRPLVRPGRLLARNLANILGLLAGVPERQIRNVLLFFHRGGFDPPQQIVNTCRQPLERSSIGCSEGVEWR